MSVRSGQSVTVLFTTRVWATGVGADATGTPTGTLYLNGASNAATVTVTNLATGIYKAAVTLPTLAVGDEVEILITATVSGVADSAIIWGDTKDVFAGAIPDVVAGGANGLFIAGTNAATTVTTSFTTTFTGNLTGSVASVTAGVTVTTNNDKTGYSLANGSFVTATFGTCDFTATMKTSIGTAVAASAVASVTGNVGGNVAGSVGSVTGLTASDVGAIKAKTDNLPSDPADASDIATLFTALTSHGDSAWATATGFLTLTTAVATSNTANTVGDCLNAARAQGFGKWVITGTTLVLYAADGTTAVRTFALDSSSAPTQRV